MTTPTMMYIGLAIGYPNQDYTQLPDYIFIKFTIVHMIVFSHFN